MSLNGKTVLVTGGTGFIGRNLCLRLIQKNANVIVADDFSYSPVTNVIEGVQTIKLDVSDSLKLDSKLGNKEVDFVFHFAGPSSVVLFNRNPAKCFEVTVSGLLNVLKYAIRNNVRKIIFPSSGSVYGRKPPLQSEDDPPRPVNLYGIAKHTCEAILAYYRKEIDYVCLRIFAGYGPGEAHKGDYASPATLFLSSMINDRSPVIFGDGSQERDFVYIDDVVSSIIAAAQTQCSGIVNVGSGKSYSFNRVIDLINRRLRKSVKPVYVEKPTAYLERTQADISKMREIFDIAPVDLDVGIGKYLEYIRLGNSK